MTVAAQKAHLAPGQHVAHEAGRHHQQEQNDAEDPQHLARLLVGAVIHATGDVGVNGGKEERRAVGMQVAQQPAVIDVAHDRFDGDEGEIDMRRVMHRQHDAGDDLHAEHEGQNAAERPPIVQVARGRIGDEGGVDEAHDRQPPLEPLHEWALRLIGRMSAHNRTLCLIRLAGHPIRAANRTPSLPGGVQAADRPVASGLGKVRGDAYRRRFIGTLAGRVQV